MSLLGDKEDATPAKSQTRIVRAIAVCGILTCAIVGRCFYTTYTTPYEYVKPGTRRHSKAEIARMKQNDVAHALRLREKWRSWAEAHQNLLRKMHRNKGDEAVLQEFVAAIPGDVVFEASTIKPADAMQITSDDIGGIRFGMRAPSPEDLQANQLEQFAWLPFSVKGYQQMKWLTKDGEKPTDLDQGRIFVLGRWRKTFSETGEVALTTPASYGYPRTILWASGRVTSLKSDTPNQAGRLDTAVNNPQIKPPFDFLR